MSIAGKKSLEWKHRFFDAFEALEKALLQKHIQEKDAVWIAQRHSYTKIRQEAVNNSTVVAAQKLFGGEITSFVDVGS